MTYLLLAVVLGVWGVVAWKIFFARPDGPVGPLPVAVPAVRAAQVAADTLRLDYRDPFLRTAIARPVADRPMTVAPVQGNAPAPVAEPPAFTYTGMIRKGRTPYFLFTVDGAQQMVRMDGQVGGYRLTEGCADSVLVTKDNHNFYLKP